MGREGLSEIDQLFLDFGDLFEKELVNQSSTRTLEETMDIGWSLLQNLPISELNRLNDEQIEQYIKGARKP